MDIDTLIANYDQPADQPTVDLDLSSNKVTEKTEQFIEGYSWKGRLVAWLKPLSSEQRASNRFFKQEIKQALTKILGDQRAAGEVVDDILGKSYSGSRAITSRAISQIVDKTKQKNPISFTNWKQARVYFNELEKANNDLNDCSLKIQKKYFFETLSLDSSSKENIFNKEDFDQIKETSDKNCEFHERVKLEQVFPNLAKHLTLNLAVSNSLAVFQHQIKIKKMPEDLKASFLETLTALKTSSELLVKMHFNPVEAENIKEDLANHQEVLQACQHKLAFIELSDDTKKDSETLDLKSALFEELGTQAARLSYKIHSLEEYILSDPFSDRNVAYSQRIQAEAAKRMTSAVLGKIMERMNSLADQINQSSDKDAQKSFSKEQEALEASYEKLSNSFDEWYHGEIKAFEAASTHQRSLPPEAYKKPSFFSKFFSSKSNFALSTLKKICKEAAVPGDILVSSISSKDMKRVTPIVMNEELEWNTKDRTLVSTLNKVTKTYKTTSTPFAQGNTALGKNLRDQGIKGIVPASRGEENRSAAINGHTIVLNECDDQGETTLINEQQKHAINDHFNIKDPIKRAAANEASAKQLLQAGMEADPDFIRSCLKNNGEGMMVYSNINLTTPTSTNRGAGHDEKLYSENQAKSFLAVCGNPLDPNEVIYNVRDPDTGELVEITVKTVFIDARFPVNYAIDKNNLKTIADQFLGGVNWQELDKHNEGQLELLFGSTEIGDPVTGVMEKTYSNLSTLVEQGDLKAKHLKVEIDEDISYLRTLFKNKEYQVNDGDRFKMSRHLGLLNNNFRIATKLTGNETLRVVNAKGCMSGKDRAGVDMAEEQSGTVVRRMGGTVAPGHILTQEENVIYNQFVTTVVDNTLQVTGFGGSKNAGEVKGRIGDKDAVIYAKGRSRNAKK